MDTPAAAAASSLVRPRAIACQNGHRAARCKTGGRPGERNFARKDTLDFLFFPFINTSFQDVLRRWVEFTQFTNHEWQKFLRDHNLVSSMSRRGNCHDNAVAESFFQLLRRERIRRQIYATREDARAEVFNYIEMFYNPRRRHSSAAGLSPVEFEQRHSQRLASV